MIAQSVYYMPQMISILRQRANEYAERKRKGIKMYWFKPLTPEQIDKIDAYNKKKKQ